MSGLSGHDLLAQITEVRLAGLGSTRFSDGLPTVVARGLNDTAVGVGTDRDHVETLRRSSNTGAIGWSQAMPAHSRAFLAEMNTSRLWSSSAPYSSSNAPDQEEGKPLSRLSAVTVRESLAVALSGDAISQSPEIA